MDLNFGSWYNDARSSKYLPSGLVSHRVPYALLLFEVFAAAYRIPGPLSSFRVDTSVPIPTLNHTTTRNVSRLRMAVPTLTPPVCFLCIAGLRRCVNESLLPLFLDIVRSLRALIAFCAPPCVDHMDRGVRAVARGVRKRR